MSALTFVCRQAQAAKRSWETDEAYWFFSIGQWDGEFGLFRGFGLGVLVFRDEIALTFGCFGLSATRRVGAPRESEEGQP